MHTEPPPMYAWQDVPWRRVERASCKRPKRIYRASGRGERSTVRPLQRRLLPSWSAPAQLLATPRVPQDNRGQRTAGGDGVTARTPPQRLRLARTLHLPGKAPPVRRGWIPKPHTDDKRPLGSPVMQARARQAMATLALEPAWEAQCAPHSYGFRPGRSCHAALAALYTSSNKQAKDVLDTDIATGCDRIHQQALLTTLHTFPTMRRARQAWRKASLMDGDHLLPTDTGVPQGAVLAPLLMNVALHGLATAVARAFPRARNRQRWQPTVISYADALVVLHRHRGPIAHAQQVVSTGLHALGLTLKPRTTRITPPYHPCEGERGVAVLGCHLRPYPGGKDKTGKGPHHHPRGFKSLIPPSKAGQRTHRLHLTEMVRTLRAASPQGLIGQLKPRISGWSHY
jgi:RNA-directed DNA polymerase